MGEIHRVRRKVHAAPLLRCENDTSVTIEDEFKISSTFIHVYTTFFLDWSMYNNLFSLGIPLICSRPAKQGRHCRGPMKAALILMIFFWLVVWNIFVLFHLLGRIIPTDFFSEGWLNHQPDDIFS